MCSKKTYFQGVPKYGIVYIKISPRNTPLPIDFYLLE